MDRTEIEVKLNKDRAWLLETIAQLPSDELTRGVTPSEHDPSISWSVQDHLVHLAGIERTFNDIIRRHFAGEANAVGLVTKPDGTRRPMDEIMTTVHAMNEEWVAEHRPKPLSEIVALGQKVRGETLAFLAGLTDEQLAQKVPGAPWAEGVVGGIIAVNADHGRMHWQWLKEKAGW